MNTSHPITNKILNKFRQKKGVPIPTRDLLSLGTRSAVDQALSRLVRQGLIRRVRRGVYELPRIGKLLKQRVSPSPDELIRAWARSNALRVVPSGAYATNLLGLSTQVPAKIVYYTNGRTQTVNLDSYHIKLLNRGPKTMDISGQTAPLVFQALRYLGKTGTTPQVIQRLRNTLPKKGKTELQRNLQYAAAWMKPVIEKIVGEEKP